MRYLPNFFYNAKAGNFVGSSKAHGRVTVEPYWRLRETTPVYGKSIRGPYRWYNDPDRIEYEIPSIKSITWNRSNSQDFASCTITIYNTWHNRNLEAPELAGQFGKPGYFWPHRGKGDSAATWDQEPGLGAYDFDGNWDANFSWSDVLVEDALLRTYEGYGGKPSQGNYVSIADNLSNENLLQTGVWIIDSVVASSDGLMTLNCTDIGRILVDQTVFPPVVPAAVYPLEYYPPGKSAFDSPWGPPVASQLTNEAGQSISIDPANLGEVRVQCSNASAVGTSTVNATYGYANAADGNWSTVALSEAYSTADGGTVWWEFIPGGVGASGPENINGLQIKPWAGGYTMYISVYQSGAWVGTDTINGLPYVKKVEIPLALPDGTEPAFNVQFGTLQEDASGFEYMNSTTYSATKVRLTFQNLYYSGIPDGTDMYRAGIRDLVLHRNSLYKTPESGPLNFNELSWTFALESHPVKGYWVVDSVGTVYGFGDAADYDSTAFGQIPLTFTSPSPPFFTDPGGTNTNRIVGLASHPNGKGYWAVDWTGKVYAQGYKDSAGTALPHYGDVEVPDPFQPFGSTTLHHSAKGIVSTHTGNGYWVVYSHGVIHGFGDASPNYATIPNTTVGNWMQTYLWNKTSESPVPTDFYTHRKATAIAAHPKKMGFWVTDSTGQVWAFGDATWHGGVSNKVYARGMADGFNVDELDVATTIESTVDGNGYWIGFASGKVAAFGNATKLGKTPYVFERAGGIYPDNVLKADSDVVNPEGFRQLVWSIARDPDGEGFWVLRADGQVKGYEADFWGQPGYGGLTGLRWHDGNFNGDWMEIVKEVLMWGGFLDYDPAIANTEMPGVYGALESTGIYTESEVPADKFDKSTLIDVIKELAEAVGYYFRIDEEGAAIFSSPNWWRAGNFDSNGVPIYVTYDEVGDYTRVNPDTEGAVPFIPIIHEDEDMLAYTATLSSADKRSKVIVGSDLPDAKDPSITSYIEFIPPHSLTTVSGGISNMRGINRTAIWISELMKNEIERKLMAELISIHSYFGARAGQCSIVGNPALSIGDQVRLVERNSSETFIHLINTMNSSLDNDTGVYTMDLTTFWMGSADDWVITADPQVADDYSYIVISDELNSWQLKTGRELQASTIDRSVSNVINGYGEFDAASSATNETWEFNGGFSIFGTLNSFRIVVETFINLGTSAYLELRTSGGALVEAVNITYQGQTIHLGNYTATELTSYTFSIVGNGGLAGEGRLGLKLKADQTTTSSVFDSIVFVTSSDLPDPEDLEE